jgi:C2 domain
LSLIHLSYIVFLHSTGLPDNFEVGTIKILSVQAEGLENKEWAGKSDPFFRANFGDYNESSVTLSNAGCDVVWGNVDMFIEVDRRSLGREKLTISVFDENVTRGDSALGIGVVSVSLLCRAVGIEKRLRIDLSDEKGALCGALTVTAVLLPSSVQVFIWFSLMQQ